MSFPDDVTRAELLETGRANVTQLYISQEESLDNVERRLSSWDDTEAYLHFALLGSSYLYHVSSLLSDHQSPDIQESLQCSPTTQLCLITQCECTFCQSVNCPICKK